MTINQRIIAALGHLAPVEPDSFTADGTKTYYTFTYNSFPIAFSNNAPTHEKFMIQVHLFCPLRFDSVSLRQETKSAIANAGFIYPEEVNASEGQTSAGFGGIQHYVYSFETVEVVGSG